MKKGLIAVIAVFLCLSLSVPLVYAGANDKALEQADENAIFNRVGDWFATVGKSDEEKAQIKAERKAARAMKRAEKAAMKAEKEAKEKGSQMKKDMTKKMNKGS